jgi:putative hydrolase of the HAD superfamily
MAVVLAELRSKGFKVGIVTNGETDFQTRHINALGLADLVDTILISESEGVRKPEREIFTHAALRLGVDPEGCIFVGDNPAADILGAHAAGMRTVWLSHGGEWPANLPSVADISIANLIDLTTHLDQFG